MGGERKAQPCGNSKGATEGSYRSFETASSQMISDQKLRGPTFQASKMNPECELGWDELECPIKVEPFDDVLVDTSRTNGAHGGEIKEDLKDSEKIKTGDNGDFKLFATVGACLQETHLLPNTNVNVSPVTCQKQLSDRNESTVFQQYVAGRLRNCHSPEAISAINLSSKPLFTGNYQERLHSDDAQPIMHECLLDSSVGNTSIGGPSSVFSHPLNSTSPFTLESSNMTPNFYQCLSVSMMEDSSKEVNIENFKADMSDETHFVTKTCEETTFNIPEKNKKVLQLEKRKEKHPLRERCKCREFITKCSLITEPQRVAIHNEFWQSDLIGRRSFFEATVTPQGIKRRRKKKKPNKIGEEQTPENEKERMRNVTYLYHLPLSLYDRPIPVCKKMFLSTLGLSNDSSLAKFFRAKATDPMSLNYLLDPRGGDRRSNNGKLKTIIDHINGYNLITLDCCLRNGNNVRYLPKDLTVSSMFASFKEKYPDCKVCIQTFRKIVKTVVVLSRLPTSDICDFCDTQQDEKFPEKL
ncbi:uncharacterized protein LOC136043878 isoform X1 [Artemia franciscana]|uniref:uncharacterized protein LOC136043878 isoform X1 n=2 Tax=Artemia franciscana TaxID=6661 RepID=UPI0032D9F708